MTLFWITFSFGALAICLMAYYIANKLYHAWLILESQQENSMNNDKQAIEKIIEVVSMAENKVEIFDDGDKIPESVYDHPGFVGLIRSKLDDNDNFTIKCLFNSDNPDLAFREEFKDEDRVEIRVRKFGDPRSGHHYRIIDDGKMVYFSDHKPGSNDREYWILSRADVPRWCKNHFSKMIERNRQDDSLFMRVPANNNASVR